MPWSGYSKYPGQATQPVLRHMFLVIPRRSLSRVPLISWPGYDCQATFNTLASPGQGSWSSLVRPHDQSYAAYPWSYPGMAWPGYGSGFAVIESGPGEYSRSRLTPHQEGLFQAEVEKWIESGWLVPHNPEVHRQPAAVLPLIAQVQEHKATTPVRPVLDYRLLNKHLISTPGRDAVVCEETLRKWRKDGDPSELALLNIKKAYLQVHVAPELFASRLWSGKGSYLWWRGWVLGSALLQSLWTWSFAGSRAGCLQWKITSMTWRPQARTALTLRPS